MSNRMTAERLAILKKTGDSDTQSLIDRIAELEQQVIDQRADLYVNLRHKNTELQRQLDAVKALEQNDVDILFRLHPDLPHGSSKTGMFRQRVIFVEELETALKEQEHEST